MWLRLRLHNKQHMLLKRKLKAKVPVSTAGVRRSPRFKHAGDKLDLGFDVPKKKTKVMPKVQLAGTSKAKSAPPPLSAQELQKIGIDKCGLLPEEVTLEKLLKKAK
uniref:Uncharacterized protein n=1 Tax=Leersia perrieri TaxID=77586 RepID=A0A0D9VUE8_9ORYZ